MNRLIVISALISVMLTGCSGCSESGIRHQSAQNLDRNEYDSNSRVTAPYQSDKNSSDNERQNPRVNENRSSLSDLYDKSKSAVFTVYTSNDEMTYQGSGFFINSDGLAVSNYHIFEGTVKGNEVIVTESGAQYNISEVIEKDEEMDYIIFEVGGSSRFDALNISTFRPDIGEEVFAIGNPRGFTHSLSTGIISSYREDGRLLQTTADITHGSSGGALLNMRGEVVGITTSGIGEANLNFAIDIQKLRLHRFPG